MDAISWGLSNFLDEYLKTKSDSLIKIEYNERDKHFLILTKRRSDVLEQLLDKHNIIKLNYNEINYEIKKDDLEFRHLPKGNNTKIFLKEMERNSVKMLEYQDKLKILQKKY